MSPKINEIRLSLILPLIAVFCMSCGSTGRESSSSTMQNPKPNILLILTDDQGYTTLGSFGGRRVKTPNLDRLANQGTLFTDAYVTSQCTPTRASLLTGQYTARHGMWHVIGWYGYPWARMTEPPFTENLSRDSFTLAKGLQKAGYATGIFGKWHLTTTEDGHYNGLEPKASNHFGFDVAGPIISRDYFEEGRDRGVGLLTEQALSFMDKSADKPWFCFLSHHMIHGKVVAPDSLVEKYRRLGYGDEGPNRAVYLAGLELIDWSVGRLIKKLEATGELEETVIIFLSDNGGIDERYDFRSVSYTTPENIQFQPDILEYDNFPLRAGKGSVYEGGTRVPMIISWPGVVQENSKSELPVHVVDLMPTLLDLAGTKSESIQDGLSLVPMLKSGNQSELQERPIYQYYPFYDLLWGQTPCASIRVGDYKLIEFFGDRVDSLGVYHQGQRTELYDLSTDIGEQNNLVETKPEIARQLKTQLESWYIKMNLDLPAENVHYNPSRAFESTREKPNWY